MNGPEYSTIADGGECHKCYEYEKERVHLQAENVRLQDIVDQLPGWVRDIEEANTVLGGSSVYISECRTEISRVTTQMLAAAESKGLNPGAGGER